jgi:hypothetical protein
MSAVLLSLMKRAYVAKVVRLVKSGLSVKAAQAQAASLLPKAKPKAPPERVH